MITITDLDYRIGNKPILHNINLELAPGGIIALIGPNGAGKSTLLSLIARLNPLQSGSIRVDTLDIATSDSRAIARKLAILQQQTRFMSRLTIEELLTFARFPYHRGRPFAHDRDIIKSPSPTSLTSPYCVTPTSTRSPASSDNAHWLP